MPPDWMVLSISTDCGGWSYFTSAESLGFLQREHYLSLIVLLRRPLAHLIHSLAADGKRGKQMSPLTCHLERLVKGRLTSLIWHFDGFSAEAPCRRRCFFLQLQGL